MYPDALECLSQFLRDTFIFLVLATGRPRGIGDDAVFGLEGEAWVILASLLVHTYTSRAWEGVRGGERTLALWFRSVTGSVENVNPGV